MTTRRELLAGAGALLAAGSLWARSDVEVEMQTLRYALIDGKELLLDLYRPNAPAGKLPVIVFVHGGGWQRGTRTTGPDFKRFFAQDGFAVAAIDYRLTPSITFPANVEDVRSSVRWLRGNADEYGLDADRIGLWGTSAGGHLAAIAALASSSQFLSNVHPRVSSHVRCVLDAYGPVAFDLMDRQAADERPRLHAISPALAEVLRTNDETGPRSRVPIVHDAPDSPESRLVGAPIQSVPEKVRAASPLTYVHSNAPPFLLMHGLADDLVPHQQSVLLYEALARAHNDVTLRLIDGLPHTFFNRSDIDEVAGPHRMAVRQSVGGQERRYEERAGVFNVARKFFTTYLA